MKCSVAITFCLALISAAVMQAHAQEVPPKEAEPSWSDSFFGGSHSSMESGIFSFVDYVDEFFGNERTDEQRKDDFFRIGGEVRFREGSAVRFRQKVRAGINLEAISHRLRLIAEGDRGDRVEEGQAFSDSSEGNDFVQDLGSNSGRAGLRYSILENSAVDLDLDGGMRFSGGVNPYARLRGSHFFAFDERWSFEPAQFLLWERQDGFGEKSRIDFNYLFLDHSLARSRTEALWAENSRGVDLYQEFSYFQQLDRKSFAGALATLAAYTRPGYTNDEYRLAVRYRTELGWPWLIGEVEPAFAFPDAREHKITPEIILRLDVYFDRIKDNPLKSILPIGPSDERPTRAERSLQIDQPN